MAEVLRNDYLAVTGEDDFLTLAWHKEEPDDAHATATAETVTGALEGLFAKDRNRRFRVLIDLIAVRKTFPRAIATYATWLVSHKGQIRAGAFATKSMLLRAAVSAAVLIPGLTMKGFSDLDQAKAFVASR